MKLKGEDNNTHVVIYNADKQDVVGIFSMITLSYKYLFPENQKIKLYVITYSIRNNTPIRKTIFPFKVIARYPKKEHLDILGDNDFVILNNYPKPKRSMRSFCSTAFTLADYQVYKRQRQLNKNKSTLVKVIKDITVEEVCQIKEDIIKKDSVEVSNINEYRGFGIKELKNKIQILKDGQQFSSMPVTSIKAAKNIIDSYLRLNL